MDKVVDISTPPHHSNTMQAWGNRFSQDLLTPTYFWYWKLVCALVKNPMCEIVGAMFNLLLATRAATMKNTEHSERDK